MAALLVPRTTPEAALALMHAERAVLSNPPAGFFPTPQECALAMARRLDLRTGLAVLDPSGGFGNLLDACRFLCPDASYQTAERAPELQSLLFLPTTCIPFGQAGDSGSVLSLIRISRVPRTSGKRSRRWSTS